MQEITHSYRIVIADGTGFNLVKKSGQHKHGHVFDYSIQQEQKLDIERNIMAYTTSVRVIDKSNDEQLLDFRQFVFLN